MDERLQFTFYRSFWDALQGLPQRDRLPVLEAIIAYALDGAEPSGLSKTQSAFFLLCKPTLDSSRKKAANGKRGGSKPKAKGKQTESEKENENEKEYENENEYECIKGDMPDLDSLDKSFSRFWQAYPCQIGIDQAQKAWQVLAPDATTAEKIMSSLDAWKKSSQWVDDEGRYIPRAAKWLSEGHWKTSPAPAKPKGVPTGASGQLGEAEMENIRRVLGGD